MLLTLTLTSPEPQVWPATDLGYVLMKNPDVVLERELPFGQASVFYPQATPERATAALLLEIDPVNLSRHTRPDDQTPLEPYVNDRPYAAGSFLAVALRELFGTAMTGKSRERQTLADQALRLEAELPCVAVRGPAQLVQRLFEPLGYRVQVRPLLLDPQYPEWGEQPYLYLHLSGTVRVADLLRHLYVLLPVLDNKKHYYLDSTEVEKLLRHGAGWLDTHPERELITSRFLRFRGLVQEAGQQWNLQLGLPQPATPTSDVTTQPEPRPASVHDQRLNHVAELLRRTGASRVLDLGCGEGKLLQKLVLSAQFSEIVGLDLSVRSLERAAERLNLKQRPELAARVKLLHGSLSYPDSRLRGFDAAVLVEVIEHLEPHRLSALSEAVFGVAQPRHVLITTPNRDYNAAFEHPEQLRHHDHRFEWTRAEFRAWASATAHQYGYEVSFEDVGEPHPDYPAQGSLTQLAHFERRAE